MIAFKSGGWHSPYTFVDEDDLLKDKRQAFVFFYDLLVNRPTEFSAFLRMFLRACNSSPEMRKHLTDRQNEATDAMMEAVKRKAPVVLYVASKLGIHKSNASRLLQRVTKTHIATLGELVTISNRDSMQSPLEDPQIRSWMYIHKRECAGSGRPATKVGGRPVVACEGHTIHNHSLCWPCMQVYGKVFGDWPEWVSFKVRDITREHRQNAIEALYRERKLVLMVDGDYELAVAA